MLDDGSQLELSISGNKQGPGAAALDAASEPAARARSGELQASITKQVIEAAPSPQDVKGPGIAVAHAERLSLEVDSLHAYTAGPPLCCRVFFKEDPAHEGRVWRCGFDGDRVTEVGFDS